MKVKGKYWHRLVGFVLGNEDEVKLEERLFHSVTIASILACLLATIGNFFIGLGPALILGSFGASFVLFFALPISMKL